MIDRSESKEARQIELHRLTSTHLERAVDAPFKSRPKQRANEPAATHREAVDELAWLLLGRRGQHKLRVRIRRLFSEKFEKLVIIVFEKPAAGAFEMTMRLQPSDLFMRLLAAVRASDGDAVAIIEHEILS